MNNKPKAIQNAIAFNLSISGVIELCMDRLNE